MRLKAFALTLAVVVLLIGRAATSEGHANLARSEPAANAVVPVSPAQILMEFTEAPDLRFSRVVVYDAAGEQVIESEFTQVGNPETVSFPVPTLPNGTYTVAYRVLSTVDGHTIVSSFSFSVGEVSANPGTPVDAFAGTTGPPKPLSVFSRWLTFVSMTAAVGLVAFTPFVLGPVLRAQPLPENVAERLRGAYLTYRRGVILFLAVAAVLALLMQAWRAAGSFSDGVSDLGSILADSRYGHTWIARILLIGVMAELTLLAGRKLDPGSRSLPAWYILGPIVLALPLTQSLNSHAAAGTELTAVGTASDWLHMVAAGAWVGGLMLFVLTLRSGVRRLSDESRLLMLAALVPRFSVLAVAAVTTIVLTGVFAWALRIGNIGDTFDNGYGLSLVAKTLLLLPMLGLGAANLLLLSPRLSAAVAEAGRSAPRLTNLVPGFNPTVGLEVVLGTLILLATAFLTDTSPPSMAASSPGSVPGAPRQEQDVDDLRLVLTVTPAKAGRNELLIRPEDRGGPKEPISLILVRFTYKEQDLGTVEMTAEATGDGGYRVSGLQMSLPGTWQVEMLVQRQGASDAIAIFEVEISPA